MTKTLSFSQKVYQLTKQIPKGKVSTYKELAKVLHSKAYQAVGQTLKANPNPPIIPCHRVVKSNGMVGGFSGQKSGPLIKKKIKLLKKEGIKFKGEKILNFNQFFFPLA